MTFQQEGNITEAVITGLSYSQMSELKYDYQIAKNKKMVDELSAGKLGYIHIPAMGEDDWQKFSRDFMVDNFAKEAQLMCVETMADIFTTKLLPCSEKSMLTWQPEDTIALSVPNHIMFGINQTSFWLMRTLFQRWRNFSCCLPGKAEEKVVGTPSRN